MRFIEYLRKFVNDVVFDHLKLIMPFNSVHKKVLVWILLITLILLVIYRYFVTNRKSRKTFILVAYFFLVFTLLFQIIYVDCFNQNFAHIRNTSVNILHLIYSLLPVSIPYFSTILLGIILFSSKKHPVIHTFLALITTTNSLMNILFFDENMIYGGEYISYFLVNTILILLPLLLVLLKMIQVNFKTTIKAFCLLLGLLTVSFLLSSIFDLMGDHSVTLIREVGKSGIHLFNYNFTVSPYVEYTTDRFGQITIESKNQFLYLFFHICPVPGLYILIVYLLFVGFVTLIFILIQKEKTIQELRLFFKHPIHYLKETMPEKA